MNPKKNNIIFIRKIFNSSSRPKYKLKTSNKLKPFLYISKIRYRSIIDKINKGNIEVTNILQNFVLGRKIKINQKGNTPMFNHK